MTATLLDAVGEAWSGGECRVTLADLVARIGFSGDSLAGVKKVEEMLASGSVELVPTLDHGGLETERILRPRLSAERVSLLLSEELKAGEGPSVEFKSSLLYHRQRAIAVPKPQSSELRSDEVLESTLKTVCGFVNCGGGVVLVGVADDGSIVGIEDDYQFTRSVGTDAEKADKWELALRDYVRTLFHEGGRISDAIQVSILEHSGRRVARIKVGTRRKLAALKTKTGYAVFVRRGNRTERLEPFEIEDIVSDRLLADG